MKEELGIKIAENPEEAMWHDVIKKTETDIESMNKSLIFSKEILKLAKSRVKSYKEVKNNDTTNI